MPALENDKYEKSVRNFRYTPATSQVLSFLQDQVLTVTDVTRTKKLTEILDIYAEEEPSEEIFVVQNTRNKNAQAVIADLDYFQELLEIREKVEEASDELMYQVALERKNEKADIDLAQVIEVNGLDAKRILQLIEDEDFE